MTWSGWLLFGAVFALALATARPLAALIQGAAERPSAAMRAAERPIWALAGVDPAREMTWRGYAMAVLAFNAVGFIALYAILRLQHVLPLNPQGFGPLSPHLAFNTAVSFVTNTNWQSYGGETTLSHFSQMAGLTTQNFVSAATGIAVALAAIRGFTRAEARTIGNFWVDLVRMTLWVLLPLSLVVAALLTLGGVPQTLEASFVAKTLEGAEQTIAVGPVASQVAIKQLGTNGGGFFNVNSAHPLENPSAWTNLLQVWGILAIAAALPLVFGRMAGEARQGWALLAAMAAILIPAAVACWWAEAAGAPLYDQLGVVGGNMEGKEVRFGLPASALWAAATTGASNGSVNAMHASFTPLGGLVPMALIMLGEVLPGGVGSGLYGMLLFAVLTVFVAGLMVGRTPEYLGKRIEAREIKLAVLAIVVLPLLILGFAATAAVLPTALAGLANAGPHGLSEILYAYASAAGNNGSAFAGLTANAPWWNATLGIAMLLGRFAVIVPVLAIAGGLAAKRRAPPSAGTFPTDGPLFVALLVAVILILGGLQFFPALALGPIAEHLQMLAGKTW